MSWVIRSPSCSQSTGRARGRRARGSRRAGRAAAASRAGRCGRTPRTGRAARVGRAAQQRHRVDRSGDVARRGAAFTARSQPLHGSVTGARRGRQRAEGAGRWRLRRAPDDVLTPGSWRSGPRDGLALAGGRALTLSVREFGLLVALARRRRPHRLREELYRDGVGRPAARRRPLDRRLRAQAAREARGRAAGVALHPHPRRASATGSSPSASHPFHTHGHSAVTDCLRRAASLAWP